MADEIQYLAVSSARTDFLLTHTITMNDSQHSPYDVLIIGSGPIGLSCAIEAQQRKRSHLIVEKGCLTNSLFHFPTRMTFFSTPDLLEIGGIPFLTQKEKPARNDALEYYRRVADRRKLNVHLYEEVLNVKGEEGNFIVETNLQKYRARNVIAATGFFDIPRLMNVPGENLAKVVHYFREAHPYTRQKILVVGGGNSSAIIALECFRQGADVTLAVREEDFDPGVKYWILPDIRNRIEDGDITAFFNTEVVEIRPKSVLLSTQNAKPFERPNHFVLAMTGYLPNYDFLERIGIAIADDPYRKPVHDSNTYETNRRGLFLAGVIVGGMLTNTWFIENSRAHATPIFDTIASKQTEQS